jgi:hypothetical protein
VIESSPDDGASSAAIEPAVGEDAVGEDDVSAAIAESSPEDDEGASAGTAVS